MTHKPTTARIQELQNEPRALIGTDEGTHDTPVHFRLYTEITGAPYAVKSCGYSNGTRTTVKEALTQTNGHIRLFPLEIARISALRSELQRLQREVANTN